MGRALLSVVEGVIIAAPYFSISDNEDGSPMLDLDGDIEILDNVGVQAGYDVRHEPSSYVVVGIVGAGFAAPEVLNGVNLDESAGAFEIGTDRTKTVGNGS